MLAMTVMLLNRERVSAREMAERFGVSVRTIYRDLEAMDVAGIPVIAYQGGGGGYSLAESYTLDRQLLSFDGMLSILTALRGINSTLGDQRLEEAIEKFNALVPERRRIDAERHLRQFVVDLSPWGMTPSQEKRLKTIQQALSENRVLSFEYQAASKPRERRSVEPTTLVFKGYTWYLYAYCRLRKDFRLFRLTRMGDPTIEVESYLPREGSYRNIERQEPSCRLTRFLLRFAPIVRSLVEEQFDSSELTIEPDGSLHARFTMPEDQWVYGMILSYGPAVEVIAPRHVRKKIADLAQKITALYNREP